MPPVHRGSHLVVIGQLKGIDHTKDLDEVAASACRISLGKSELLGGVNHKHRTHSEILRAKVFLVRVNHIVERGNFLVQVG